MWVGRKNIKLKAREVNCAVRKNPVITADQDLRSRNQISKYVVLPHLDNITTIMEESVERLALLGCYLDRLILS
jgi:hypothetical protein